MAITWAPQVLDLWRSSGSENIIAAAELKARGCLEAPELRGNGAPHIFSGLPKSHKDILGQGFQLFEAQGRLQWCLMCPKGKCGKFILVSKKSPVLGGLNLKHN